MKEYTDYLYIAVRAAIDAGKVIMDIYEAEENEWEVEQKKDNSPLTRADKASHEIIAEALSATPFPVLSEEGKEISYDERSEWKTLWIVDPLDGTKEFIKRNGEFTVNIALVDEGNSVLGVIYVPCRKELYYAVNRTGAYLVTDVDFSLQPSISEIRGKAQRLPLAEPHSGIVVVASRSHQNQETTQYIESLKGQGRPVTLINSGSSLKICRVAEGAADIYPRFAPTMEWDTAAGHIIAQESGCVVLQPETKTPLVYNKENLLNPWFIVSR